MKKKITRAFLRTLEHGSPEYVYYHGVWRIKRGKNVSAILDKRWINPLNPKKAFNTGKSILHPKKRSRPLIGPDGKSDLERFLGLPNAYDPPWPGARKVPHTCYEWY
jgi:hypothetical protein